MNIFGILNLMCKRGEQKAEMGKGIKLAKLYKQIQLGLNVQLKPQLNPLSLLLGGIESETFW